MDGIIAHSAKEKALRFNVVDRLGLNVDQDSSNSILE
jgi:hypothetical protein